MVNTKSMFSGVAVVLLVHSNLRFLAVLYLFSLSICPELGDVKLMKGCFQLWDELPKCIPEEEKVILDLCSHGV